MPAPHRIFPYRSPRELAPNLWQIEGSLSVPVPRLMTVYRTPSGELVLYSVLAMHPEGLAALEALGRPAVMVVPHDRHHMDVGFYKNHYPELRVIAPTLDPVRGVAIDASLSALSEYGIRAYVVPGNTYRDVAMELPIADGVALCVCETLVDTPKSVRPIVRAFAKIVGPPNGGFGVARAVRWRELRGRSVETRRWLEGLAVREDLRMVLTAHGEPIRDQVSKRLAQAAATLR